MKDETILAVVAMICGVVLGIACMFFGVDHLIIFGIAGGIFGVAGYELKAWRVSREQTP